MKSIRAGAGFTASPDISRMAIRDVEHALVVARQADDQGRVADALVNVAGAYDYAGDYAEAALRYRESVESADASGRPQFSGPRSLHDRMVPDPAGNAGRGYGAMPRGADSW